jgi:tetratricopeptide (TPR) repeat protein
MRTLIDRIQASIAHFVEQRDDLVMIMACSDNDAPLVLKIVQDVEKASGSDVFLLFADDFVATGPYVAVAIERLRQQHKLVNEWLTAQGRDLFPPLPEPLDSAQFSPIQRLGQAMMYARSLLPHDGDHRLIWAMLPPTIHDRQAYLDLVSAFAAWRGVRPGMQGLRIIFRDETDTAGFMPALARAPRVRITSVDMGPAAIQSALQEEANDATLPQERRMAALLQQALLDSAHGRTQQALAQFRVLLGYYQHTQTAALQALVLNAIGDIFHRTNDCTNACYWYECAVPLAVKSESPVLLHTAVSNLADIAFKCAAYGLAEQLYDAADQLAGKMLYAEGMVHARERCGLSREYQHAYERAVQSWEAAANVSRTTGLLPQLKANLQHLARSYQRLGMVDKRAAVEAELRQLAG